MINYTVSCECVEEHEVDAYSLVQIHRNPGWENKHRSGDLYWDDGWWYKKTPYI